MNSSPTSSTTAPRMSTTTMAGPHAFCIEWNAENELTRVTKNSVEQARFKYDPKGRRVENVAAGVTTTYTHDLRNVLREAAGGSSQVYVNEPGLDGLLGYENTSGLRFYHADGLGSVIKVTDAAGAAILSRSYSAYGAQGTAAAGRAFAARDWDAAVNLYYYRARYYDPAAGRFLSEDPSGFDDGLNRYQYVRSSPTNFIDPTGLITQMCCRLLSSYWGLSGALTGQRHCFIVIFGNPNIPGGAGPAGGTSTYSLIPRDGTGEGRKNYSEDVDSFFNGEAKCYSVGHCTPCREETIDQNYQNAGPSGAGYRRAGPNSNTYARRQATDAGCVPPGTIPDAPGY